ncbi:MAG: hypothetical protein AB3N28_10655 [Kordiimonas sp.]
MFRKTVSLAVTIAVFLSAGLAQAGDIEDAIITKVVKAYGGDALVTAKSIKIIDYSKSLWPGQSEVPSQPDFFRDNAELTVDFLGKRKSMLSWRVSRTAKDLDRFVFDGQKGRIYDVLNHKYSDEPWLTYSTLGARVIRASDTMIARNLQSGTDTVVYGGEVAYRGEIHQKLHVATSSGREHTLFIDKASGLISKKERYRPNSSDLTYVFSNHRQADGVTYAQDMNFFVGDAPRQVSVDRRIELNPEMEQLFTEPKGYSGWGEIADTTEMRVQKLASNVYHAGKGRSFSVFIDTGDYFVAAGGEAGLKDKLQAVSRVVGKEKPLKYMVLTHHHNEHLRALNEAVELGANIVTVEDHLSTVHKNTAADLPSDRLSMVNGKLSVGNGAVEIYDITTAHSKHYLLVYVPEAKIVFAEDHYGTELVSAVPRVHKDMVRFREKIESLGFGVEMFVDGHGPRILTNAEFKDATDAYGDIVCPEGYMICAKG